MSNYLALDTSSRYLTVLAVKGEKKVLRHSADCAMQHSVRLMGEVEAALEEAGLTPAECDFFAAVTGPGSFTGIRIGIATAKGFSKGAEKPLEKRERNARTELYGRGKRARARRKTLRVRRALLRRIYSA